MRTKSQILCRCARYRARQPLTDGAGRTEGRLEIIFVAPRREPAVAEFDHAAHGVVGLTAEQDRRGRPLLRLRGLPDPSGRPRVPNAFFARTRSRSSL